MDKETSKQEIKVEIPASLKGGVYSNLMGVRHRKEEFVLDFMMVTPPEGTVTARVIISPGHMKRMVSAIKDNLEKYEKKFGKLAEAAEPGKPAIGFQSHSQ